MSKNQRPWLVPVVGIVAISALGCGDLSDPSDPDVSSTESPIIGGGAVSVATRRALGLIDVITPCSGALFNKDWVLTAAHCVPSWGNPTTWGFSAPRTDGNLDTRTATQLVQIGSTDMVLVKLGPEPANSQWPNVSHPVTTASESSFVGGSITCYGRGNTAYQPDGTGVQGLGTWRVLSKTVDSLVPDPFFGDGYRMFAIGNPGTETFAFGDSGGNCFTPDGQGVGVLTHVDCASWVGQGQPGVECTSTNVISFRDTYASATADFRNYMTQAPNRPAASYQPLALVNGWQAGSYGTNAATFTMDSGVVELRGGIQSGTTPAPFQIPPGFQPSARVYVSLSTTNNTLGRLVIEPLTGNVVVEGESGSGFANASFFTSLDGVTFLRDASGATPLTLKNGWTTTVFGTRAPAVRIVGNFIRFMGAMAGGTGVAFTLPPTMRPIRDAYVPVGLANAKKGRLNISTNGDVSVQAEGGGTADLKIFTSLEGASFPIAAVGSIATLQNGWVGGTYNTHLVRYANEKGIVRLSGGASGGTSSVVFTLPPNVRPATKVYLPVDTMVANRGRIVISPDGTVAVDQGFTNATQFLSFDGVSFGL